MVFAFDIETHDIIRENTRAWLCGHYGFSARVLPSTMESLRLIQIGWATGNIHSDTPTTISRYVIPDDFEVTAEGAAKHGVTQAVAKEHGLPLTEALKEVLRPHKKHLQEARDWRHTKLSLMPESSRRICRDAAYIKNWSSGTKRSEVASAPWILFWAIGYETKLAMWMNKADLARGHWD